MKPRMGERYGEIPLSVPTLGENLLTKGGGSGFEFPMLAIQ